MRHLDDPLQRVHVLRMEIIAWFVGNCRAGKDMPAETGDNLAAVTKKFIDLADFAGIMVTDLLLADKLQLGIVQPEFIHHVDGYNGVVSFESVYHPGNGDFEAGFRMNIEKFKSLYG